MYRVLRQRRGFIAAAFALLGVLAYALLLPGHLTSQFQAKLWLADVGIFAESMCQSDGSGDGERGKPQSNCPICKSVGAFQLALAAPESAALPAIPHAGPAQLPPPSAVVGSKLPAPRSRGPPLSA